MGNARSSGRMQRSVDMPQNVGYPSRKVKQGEFLLRHSTGRILTLSPQVLYKHADICHLWAMASVLPLSGLLFRVRTIADT
jgi:hypothetical protein